MRWFKRQSKQSYVAAPSPIDADERLRVQCSYCEQEIEYQGLDPCAVILVTRWAESEAEQASQQFFCHAECLRRSGSGTDLYVLDEPEFGR